MTSSFNALVSVIIPAYNAERFISQTIESVIVQTYHHLEILIVDDCSSDTTVDIIEQYALKDDRIMLIRQKNAGVAAARNTAIEKARGEFIAPIDADDIWFPEFIETLVPLMVDPKVGMSFAWSVFINEEGKLTKTCQSSTWEGKDYISLIYHNCPGNASCVLMRRSCVQQVGGYDPSYRELNAQGCEDWDIYLKLAEKYQLRVASRLLVGYRQVIGSMSSSNPERMRRGSNLILDRIAERHPEIDSSLYRWHRSNFAWYLAIKCSQVGNHYRTLAYMYHALTLDYFPLLRPGFYRQGLSSILKLICEPLTSKIWKDHSMWVDFKVGFKAIFKAIIPWKSEINLTDLERRQKLGKNYFPRRQYEQFATWRCNRIRTIAKVRLSMRESETTSNTA